MRLPCETWAFVLSCQAYRRLWLRSYKVLHEEQGQRNTGTENRRSHVGSVCVVATTGLTQGHKRWVLWPHLEGATARSSSRAA